MKNKQQTNSSAANGLLPAGFLDLPVTGKTDWWRYVVSILAILFGWQVIGAIPYIVLAQTGLMDDALINYITLNLSFIALIAALALSMLLIHRRKPVTLVTPNARIDIKAIIKPFVIWVLITLVATAIDAVIHPGSYQVSFNLMKWLEFLPFALILTPLQAAAEELLFRGYALQTLGHLSRNKWVLAILSGVIFAVPHFMNPEMQYGAIPTGLYYFCFGLALTLITLKTNNLSAAIGIHAANNLFTVLIANYRDSALPSPSVFTAAIVDPVYNLAAFILGILVFYLILLRKDTFLTGS